MDGVYHAGLAILLTLSGEVAFSSILRSRMHLPAQAERHDVEEPVLDDKQQAYAHMQVSNSDNVSSVNAMSV